MLKALGIRGEGGSWIAREVKEEKKTNDSREEKRDEEEGMGRREGRAKFGLKEGEQVCFQLLLKSCSGHT